MVYMALWCARVAHMWCCVALQTKRAVAEECRDAAFSLTEAVWAAGSIKNKVLEAATVPSERVMMRFDNVAGVKLPMFEMVSSKEDVLGNIGLARGGKMVTKYVSCV